MSPIVVQAIAASLPLPTLVQSASDGPNNSVAAPVLGSTPTPGNILIGCYSGRDFDASAIPNFTVVSGNFQNVGSRSRGRLVYRIVQPGDATNIFVVTSTNHFPLGVIAEFNCPQGTGNIDVNLLSGQPATTAPTLPITLTGTTPWLEVFSMVAGNDGSGNSSPYAMGAGWNTVWIDHTGAGETFAPMLAFGWKGVTSSLSGAITGPNQSWGGAIMAVT